MMVLHNDRKVPKKWDQNTSFSPLNLFLFPTPLEKKMTPSKYLCNRFVLREVWFMFDNVNWSTAKRRFECIRFVASIWTSMPWQKYIRCFALFIIHELNIRMSASKLGKICRYKKESKASNNNEKFRPIEDQKAGKSETNVEKVQ